MDMFRNTCIFFVDFKTLIPDVGNILSMIGSLKDGDVDMFMVVVFFESLSSVVKPASGELQW